MKHVEIPRQRFAAGLILVVLLAGIFVIFSDWANIQKVLLQADWYLLPYAALFTVISYACVSYNFAKISRLLGIKMGEGILTEIGFVTAALNHVVSSGGIAGYSLRYVFMKGHGVSLQDVLAASILHFYLTSLAMLAVLPGGFAYLMLNAALPRGVAIGLGIGTAILSVVFILITGVVLVQSFRRPVLEKIQQLVKRFTKWDFDETIQQFDQGLTHGVGALRHQPKMIALVFILIALDWVTSAVVLWYCFDALGNPVSPGVLMSGFVIGIMAGVASMIPGGLGIQEGSMAGVFNLLGVSFEQALLASILFRVMYFLLPYFASLGLYWRLIRKSDEAQSQRSTGEENAHSHVKPRLSPYHQRSNPGRSEDIQGDGEQRP
jgi:uncharacterized protein (TIRG00374 family)